MKKELTDSFSSQFSQKEAYAKLVEADKILTTLGDFTDEDIEAIQEVAKNYGLASVALKNPDRAARLAVRIWMEENGIPSGQTPAAGENGKTPSKEGALGVRGGNSQSAGLSGNTLAEELRSLKGTPEYESSRERIRLAIQKMSGSRG